MTQTQAAGAVGAAVQVVGQGTRMRDGLPFLLVSSQSEVGRVHVCTYTYEGAFVGSRMLCDCVAASYGRACKHVLVARAWLAGSLSGAKEATRLAQAEQAAFQPTQPQPQLQPQPQRADVVTPLLRHPRGNEPFSLLKH